MQRLISAICAGLILGTGLILAFAQPADDAQERLQGTWTATKAERDGNAADDVVGHRLSFTGNRFQILSKDGKPLYAGTVRVNPSAKPGAIDFEHTEEALKGKTWKGIYLLDGDTLTVCDMLATNSVAVCSSSATAAHRASPLAPAKEAELSF